MKYSKNFLLISLLSLIILSGCKGDDIPDGLEFQTSIDNSIASSEFSSIRNMIDIEAINDTNIFKNGLYCPNSNTSVTVLGPNTVRLEIDFGSGSTCVDGRLRSGIITCTFTGLWRNPGSSVVIAPTNYVVNGFPVTFSKTMTNLGRNTGGNLEFDVVVANAQITTLNGTIQWGSHQTTEWIAGESTPFNLLDNEYLITGDASGNSRTGLHFEVEIDEALHIKMNCSNIVAGVLSLTPDNRTKRSIDYGEGACDNVAVLTVGSYVKNFTLP